MMPPSKEFIFQEQSFPLNSPIPRVTSQQVHKKSDELITTYIYGISELSNYSGELFGEIGNTQFVSYTCDSPEVLLKFASDTDLELVTGSVSCSGYGSVNKAKFIKPEVRVKADIEALEKVAEESVRAYVEGFKIALAKAKSAAVAEYEAYRQYLKQQKLLELDEAAREAQYYKELIQ